jgi:hypothetical protein
MTKTGNEVSPSDLKVIALKERLSVIVSDYEDKDADRRVEITFLSKKIEDLEKTIENLQAQLGEINGASEDTDVSGGDVPTD